MRPLSAPVISAGKPLDLSVQLSCGSPDSAGTLHKRPPAPPLTLFESDTQPVSILPVSPRPLFGGFGLRLPGFSLLLFVIWVRSLPGPFTLNLHICIGGPPVVFRQLPPVSGSGPPLPKSTPDRGRTECSFDPQPSLSMGHLAQFLILLSCVVPQMLCRSNLVTVAPSHSRCC